MSASSFEHAVLRDRLHTLRADVARLTGDIVAMMDQFVASETDVNQSGREGTEVPRPRALAALTRREVDVFRLLAAGDTNAVIAQKLIISEGTVKAHVKHILRKLGAANRAEAVSIYYRLEREARLGRY